MSVLIRDSDIVCQQTWWTRSSATSMWLFRAAKCRAVYPSSFFSSTSHGLGSFDSKILTALHHGNNITEHDPITRLVSQLRHQSQLKPFTFIVHKCQLKWYRHVKCSTMLVKAVTEGLNEENRHSDHRCRVLVFFWVQNQSPTPTLGLIVWHNDYVLKLMADGPSFSYEKLVRETWYKKFVYRLHPSFSYEKHGRWQRR